MDNCTVIEAPCEFGYVQGTKSTLKPTLEILIYYVERSSSKVSYFFFSKMEADRNVKVVGGDVAVL